MKINIGDQVEFREENKIHRHSIYKLVEAKNKDDIFIMARKEKDDDTSGYSAFYYNSNKNIKIIRNVKTNFTKSDFTKYNYKQLNMFGDDNI